MTNENLFWAWACICAVLLFFFVCHVHDLHTAHKLNMRNKENARMLLFAMYGWPLIALWPIGVVVLIGYGIVKLVVVTRKISTVAFRME